MTQIAYTDRVWNDPAQIDAFLDAQRVGVLGLSTQPYPYTVPVNYLWADGKIYFHGLGSGRKFELLSREPAASFTVFAEHGTTTDPMPCHADTSYSSVMIFGQVTRVTVVTEAAEALQSLVEKLLPGFYRSRITDRLVDNYRSGMDDNPVAVYRLTPDRLTAKQNLADPGDIFTTTDAKGCNP
jgi:nitroimidazol reductase NimA-like FMN-containing flavoprotein (pyridoxamine 5'-phosphate oxidase superfamily)